MTKIVIFFHWKMNLKKRIVYFQVKSWSHYKNNEYECCSVK